LISENDVINYASIIVDNSKILLTRYFVTIVALSLK